jgi:hypothetical protein
VSTAVTQTATKRFQHRSAQVVEEVCFGQLCSRVSSALGMEREDPGSNRAQLTIFTYHLEALLESNT